MTTTKKILFGAGTTALILVSLIFYSRFNINGAKPGPEETQGIEQFPNQGKTPELFTFVFQPALSHNTEVIISFEKKYLLFRNIYPFNPEPPPPPRKDGKSTAELTDKEKAIQPYAVVLKDAELETLREIINKLSEKDFRRIEGTYIDGTSCNFSILYNGKHFRNGFIAGDMTYNQRLLYSEILKLLYTTNKFEENLPILKYYSNF
ncbi:MAG: hypothetical protein K0M63_08855 [Weeksellaceae bacterium]|nr:hypothetical protein [Weeksellaceae bacterium]